MKALNGKAVKTRQLLVKQSHGYLYLSLERHFQRLVNQEIRDDHDVFVSEA